ncbi:MAG TPA: hypothetical protein VLC98_13600 [Phnomibacter sp.]|nr:hypothetical protein [Phnomibacter sp.]
MDPILKKLNFKEHPAIYVLQAPADLQPLINTWSKETSVKNKLGKTPVNFAMAFCITQQDVNSIAEKLLPLADGDAVIWFCYPKGTSKKYKCEFNRDNGWAALGALDWEPVRMVAIDDDWSALRFRKTNFIKTMSRSSAISAKGKERIADKKKR